MSANSINASMNAGMGSSAKYVKISKQKDDNPYKNVTSRSSSPWFYEVVGCTESTRQCLKSCGKYKRSMTWQDVCNKIKKIDDQFNIIEMDLDDRASSMNLNLDFQKHKKHKKYQEGEKIIKNKSYCCNIM